MAADWHDQTGEAGFSTRADTVSVNSGPGYQFNQSQFSGPVNFYSGESRERTDWLHKCLQSLAFPEMESRAHDIETAEPGTCEWLQHDEIYKFWRSSQKGVLWIKGKPGAGKSTLLHHALHHAKESSGGELILYFFCHGRGSDLQKTPFGLYRSLLHQLLQKAPGCGSHIVTKFQDRSESMGEYERKWQWNSSEVRRDIDSILFRVLEMRSILLFIDALDECGETDGIKIARGLQETVRHLPTNSRPFLVCFTCRPYPVLESYCEHEITVEEHNSRDIRRYVERMLPDLCDESSDSTDSPYLHLSVPRLITRKADGVFLWAHLVVEKVLQLQRQGTRAAKIKAEIDSITPNLDELYKDTIKLMGIDSLELFQWICCARRPLSVLEWRSCVLGDGDCPRGLWSESGRISWFGDVSFHSSRSRSSQDRDYIQDDALPEIDELKQRVSILTFGLAEVSESGHALQFIHESVKEYFTREGLSALTCRLGNENNAVGLAHLHLYTVCCQYIADAGAKIYPNRSFSSTDSWFPGDVNVGSYCQLSHSSSIWNFGPSFSSDESLHRSCISLVDSVTFWGDTKRNSLLFYAASSAMWHAKQSEGYGIFQLHHLNPILDDSENFIRVWLRSHLLDHRTQVDLTHILSYENMSTTLERMFQNTTKRQPRDAQLSWRNMVNRIKHRGVHCRDSLNRTPLFWAVRQQHITSTRVLIQCGANVNAKDLKGATALMYAARRGHMPIMKVLIENGARINQEDIHGHNALTHVLDGVLIRTHFFYRNVGFLLDHGARLRPTTWSMMYIIRAPPKLFEMFVDRNFKIDFMFSKNRTFLMMATAQNPELVPLILKRGGDVSAEDDNGMTAFLKACRYRRYEAAKHLLAKGSDAHHRDKSGTGAMEHLLCGRSRGDIGSCDGRPIRDKHWVKLVGLFRLLVQHGFAVNPDGSRLLLAACSSFRPPRVEVIKRLLSVGVNINACGESGYTPLTLVIRDLAVPYIREDAQAKLISNVEFLLNCGSDVNMADSNRGTPLRYAVDRYKPNFELAEFLLRRGANANMADREGFTVLGHLCFENDSPDLRVVRFLLHRGADISMIGEWGRVNLAIACLSHNPDNRARRRERRRSVAFRRSELP